MSNNETLVIRHSDLVISSTPSRLQTIPEEVEGEFVFVAAVVGLAVDALALGTADMSKSTTPAVVELVVRTNRLVRKQPSVGISWLKSRV